MTEKLKAEWRPLRPVPDDAPPPPVAHQVRGRPLTLHRYADETGALMGFVADFIRSDNSTLKQIPLAYCEDVADGKPMDQHRRAWRWRWFDPLRPLFGLDRAIDAARTHLPILLLPSEAEANAAQPLLGAEFACLSWAGGLKHIDDVDYSPIKFREVTIWLPARAERYKAGVGDPVQGEIKPLIHQPHFAPLAKLIEILNRHECKVRAVLVKPGAEPDGFCARAAFERGMKAIEVSAWITPRAHPMSGAETLRLIAPIVDGSFAAGAAMTLGPAGVPAGVASTISPPSAAGATPAENEWLKSLIRDPGTGKLLPEVHNISMILRHHAQWRDVIYQDDFAHRLMKRRPPPYEGARIGEFSDADDVMTRAWLASSMGILRVKKQDVPDAVLGVASLNRVNPLQDYLNGLVWDGQPRLKNWLITYCSAGERYSPDDTAVEIATKEQSKLTRYVQLVGPIWLVGAVKRALQPGCKFDYVLILEGQQGKGKSSALAILGGEWGMDSPISFTHKDSFEALSGIWMVEIPELDAFSKADSTTAKSFFTRSKDRYRMAYAKRTADYLRACVFAGSTNEGEFYRDTTGNRRYWAVHVRQVMIEALKRDRDQLLAEAVVWYRRGDAVYPTPKEEAELIAPEQRKRMVLDPWVLMLDDWLTGLNGPVTMSQILLEGLKLERGKVDAVNMPMRIGRVMRELGYRKVEDKSYPERFYYEKVSDAE